MPRWSGAPSPKIQWTFIVHKDGTLSFGLIAKHVRPRRENRKYRFGISELFTRLPPDLMMDGCKVKPSLIFKLYAKPSPVDIERRKWGMVRKLRRK